MPRGVCTEWCRVSGKPGRGETRTSRRQRCIKNAGPQWGEGIPFPIVLTVTDEIWKEFKRAGESCKQKSSSLHLTAFQNRSRRALYVSVA